MDVLRRYQRDVLSGCQQGWEQGDKVVMPVVPTGGGKSVIISQAALEHDGDGFVMAHRGELVGQLSIALARAGIRHGLTASKETRRTIQMLHYELFGRSMLATSNADWHVGSVDTVIRRELPRLKRPLLIQDEGHHTLRDNKWGKAFGMFPANTIAMLATATPMRADCKGLGRHAHGIVDRMIMGPSGRDLINMGMLTDYDVLVPDVADLDLSGVKVGSSGELNQKQLAEAIGKSRQLVGNIVETYLEHAYGKLAVCFAANISEATRITDAFNGAGIKAELVTGEDTEADRRLALERFRNRETLILVNVDLFGEGFDLPAIEVVIMARPTDSYSLFSQQWGRVLRLMIDPGLMRIWDTFTDQMRLDFIKGSSKPFGLVIDHVGNLLRHEGPPDIPRPMTLDNYEKRKRNAVSPIVSCPSKECLRPYERTLSTCPHCGYDRFKGIKLTSVSSDNLKKVDGDLRYFTREALEEMRKNIIKPEEPVYIPQHLKGQPAGIAATRNIARSKKANEDLRLAMAYWAGLHPSMTQEDKQKMFYHAFGIDPLTALTLKYGKSEPLIQRIYEEIRKHGYVVENLHMTTGLTVDTSNWMGKPDAQY